MKSFETVATGYTDRIRRLRDEAIHARSTICLERACVYTDVYREHPDLPVISKRAIALARTLGEMSIFIEEGGLIVGNQSSSVRAAPIFPEYAVEWIEREIDEFEKRPGDQFHPSDETKRELLDIVSFWRGNTTLDKGRALMHPQHRAIHAAGIIRAEGNLTSGDAHIAVDDVRILDAGLSSYVDRTLEKLASCDITRRDGVKKKLFYEAVARSLDGLRAFIRRFATPTR